MRRLIALSVAVILGMGGTGYSSPVPDAEILSLVALVRMEGNLEFCGEPVPSGNHDVRERYEKELLLTLADPAQVILWLKRSRRYLPPIEKMVREAGLPEDIRYVAVAESALRAHAGSSKGAVGYWQFTRSTGLRYGLTVDSRIDERRNLFASTRAAIRYFKDLHSRFGSWTLAAAAYNMGEDGLMAEILEQGTDDFYRLYLPLETQRFIFRILAVKLILSAPEKYGFYLEDHDYYPPFEFDEVRVECGEETPIRLVAQAAGTHFKAVKDFNPELRGHHLRPGTHDVLVPKGTAPGFHERYGRLLKNYLSAKEKSVYIVKPGDSLSAIADKHGVPLLSLVIWNRLDLRRPIHPGQKLIIHQEAVQGEEEEETAGKESVSSND